MRETDETNCVLLLIERLADIKKNDDYFLGGALLNKMRIFN